MNPLELNLNSSGIYIVDKTNIASVGATTITTTEIPRNGGTALLYFSFYRDLIGYGTLKSVKISYKAYGSRTGIAGSKAQIYTGYIDTNGTDHVVGSHGDVGRGSSNATSYTDTLYPTVFSGNQYLLYFRIKNPIAAQTNTVYVSNISIVIEYEPATYSITANANNSSYGTVTGGGTYEHGATATLTAKANDGYKFLKWNDDNTSATRTINVTGAATYTAYFAVDKILIGTTKPTAIYLDETNKIITFVVSGTITDSGSAGADTVDGYHIRISNSAPQSGALVSAVYIDETKAYG